MYVNKEYNPKYYIKLVSIKEKVTRLNDLQSYDNIQGVKEILKSLRITKILVGSKWKPVHSQDYLNYYFIKTIKILKKEIPQYLEKFKTKHEEEKKSGILETMCLGEQLELPYKDSVVRPEIAQDR
jgi:hypothetical protein